jgi:hypothetical protein
MPANKGTIDGAGTFNSRAPFGSSNGNPTTTRKGFMKAAGLHSLSDRGSALKHRRSGQGKGKRRRVGK